MLEFDLVLTPTTAIPSAAAPFGTIIPGVPNPGVDPVTGATPVDTAIGVAQGIFQLANLLGILISPAGLAMIGGAILLFIGFKTLNGANEGPTIAIPTPMKAASKVV
jgi:hypothetical protein